MGLVRSAPFGLALALAVAATAGDTSPDRLVLRLAAGEPGAVREARFRIERPVQVEVVATGAGPRRALSAWGWLLDADSRRPVWSMLEADPEGEAGDGAPRPTYRDRLTLPAGRYAAHFFAFKRKGHGLFGLPGLLDGSAADARAAQLELWLGAADSAALVAEEPQLDGPPGEVRLAPLGDDRLARRRFRLTRPATVRIYALGERNPRGGEFADLSWLVELESRRVVWSLADDDTVPAGGAEKNRAADRRLELAAGAYELVALTDDSHAYGAWNARPPWSPGDWGATLTVPQEAWGGFDVPAERTIARLSGARDDHSVSAVFRLDRTARVRLHALGEWGAGQGKLADRGWLEPAAGGAPLWEMRYEDSRPAGGAAKNRAVDTSIELPAGTFRARYVTDDSHSKQAWNAAAPIERHAWGLTVSTFDPAASFALVEIRNHATPAGGD